MSTEKAIETKHCKNCGASFDVTDKDLEFYDKISPVFNGKKYAIPAPTLCPDCRQQRRLSFRNERSIYKRKCNLTGKEVISIYSEDKPLTIYNQKDRREDNRDPLSYGRDVDLTRPLFEQMKELFLAVPKISLLALANQNAEFVNFSSRNKDCYLLFESDNNQDCWHGEHTFRCKNSLDTSYVSHCELCYECTDCHTCYNVKFSQDCHQCSDSWFLDNCASCQHCYACANLHNKKFCFWNEQYTKEEYQQKIADLNLGGYQIITQQKEKFANFCKTVPHKFMHGVHNEQVIGDYLQECKNAFFCFDGKRLEDCKYVSDCEKTKMTHDVVVFGGDNGMELAYEGQSIGNGIHNVLFSNNLWENVSDALYCDFCKNSSHLFGCIGLRHKEYCILNKQYTQAEYEKLVPQIIERMKAEGEWGEFFPSHVSPFGYNETVAMEYFPLTKADALKQGFNWSDYESPFPKVEKTLKENQLPDDIQQISDEILSQAIICEVSGKPFRIIKSELEFYRKHNLPLPHKHPDQRHKERMALRNPRKLRDRKCMKCGTDIKTSFAPERKEIVYCEQCYNREVYG